MKDISRTVNVNRITPEGKNCFYGYYDVSPESMDGKKILYNIATFNDHMPEKNDLLEVGYWDIDNQEYHLIGKTSAWNFQEGCRLQWIDNDNVIYNDRINDGYVSIQYNILTGKKTVFNWPIYSLDRDNHKALSYNFNRSRYSYAHNSENEKTDYSQDGVFLLDMDSNKAKLIISLETLSQENNTEDYNNWVEHCVFNTACNKFCFFLNFHRISD